MRYTFDGPDAPTRKGAQYYEMFGHRAIIADGWKAVTRHTQGVPFDDDTWELYHYDVDRSECHDLAAEHPDAAGRTGRPVVGRGRGPGGPPPRRPRIELFFTRYRDHSAHPTEPALHVLPADGAAARPGGTGAWAAGASTWRRPSTGRRGEGGVLFATGTENSGISVFVQDDRLVFDYNCFNDHHVVESDVPVPEGPPWSACGSVAPGAGGEARLFVDGVPCGGLTVPFAMHIISSVGPSVGYDHGSPVSERYRGHFPFEGTLHRVEVAVVRTGESGPARRPRPRQQARRMAQQCTAGRRRSGGEPRRGAGVDVDDRPGDVAGALRAQEHHGGGDLVGLQPGHRLHVQRRHDRGHVVRPSVARGRAASAGRACRCGSCRSRRCPARSTLAVTPKWAISWATDLVRPMTPHLDAQ